METGEGLMNEDQLRRLEQVVVEMTTAADIMSKASASIAQSALNLMTLIERTQSEAAKMIAAQLKRSERVREELQQMRDRPELPGMRIRTQDGRMIEVPPRRPHAEGDAPER